MNEKQIALRKLFLNTKRIHPKVKYLKEAYRILNQAILDGIDIGIEAKTNINNYMFTNNTFICYHSVSKKYEIIEFQFCKNQYYAYFRVRGGYVTESHVLLYNESLFDGLLRARGARITQRA